MTTTSSDQICIAPFSSPLSLLLRAHTYALVVALLAPLPRGWLFRAALAAFTTRTAIFAVDAAVILGTLRSSMDRPVPLDALLLLELLGLAALVACWLLLVSKRQSSARPLIRLWAAVVCIGCILAFVAVVKAGQMGTAGLESECHGVLMSRDDIFGIDENAAVLGRVASRFAWLARRVGAPSLIFAGLGLLAAGFSRGNDAIKVSAPDLEQAEIGISAERGGPWSHLSWAVWVFNAGLLVLVPAMAILVIVSAEQFVFGAAGLPSVEETTSVGQWGVWAATAVVLLATFVNASRTKLGLREGVATIEGPETAKL